MWAVIFSVMSCVVFSVSHQVPSLVFRTEKVPTV